MKRDAPGRKRTSISRGAGRSPQAAAAFSPAQARTIDAALELFAEHGIGGTSLQMIADAVGVTKAAIYHQYNTKEAIVLAVAQVVLDGLDAAATAAEAAASPARASQLMVAGMIDLAVERRRMAGILQRDPVMLRFLQSHPPFRRVMTRVNRLLMGPAPDTGARVRAAAVAAAIAGAVVHPLVVELDDDTLRSKLLKQMRRLLTPP